MAMIFLATSWKLILEPVRERRVCTDGVLSQPEHAEKSSDAHDPHDPHELTERAQRLNENAREAAGR
jgi:hypothetical protein